MSYPQEWKWHNSDMIPFRRCFYPQALPLVLKRGIRATSPSPWASDASPGTTSRSLTSLTSEEAGRRAARIAAEDCHKDVLSLPSVLAHAGFIGSEQNSPSAPPLHLATTSTREPDGSYTEGGSIYSRMDNKTRLLLEKTVYRLECHGILPEIVNNQPPSSHAFSSGMMAFSSIILAHSSPCTLLLHKDAYHGVPTAAIDVFSRHGVSTIRVDMQDPGQVKAAIANSSATTDTIVWIETPSNPLLHVLDIERICRESRAVKNRAVTTVLDSTLAPPTVTQGLAMGVDLVMHSATKSLAGHSDASLGLVTASPATSRGKLLAPLLKQVQVAVGGVASPFDSWLTLRGLRTLDVRMERMCKSAMIIAEGLQSNELVTHVHYPGLVGHPYHDVASRQMKDGLYGSVLSFEMQDEVWATAVAAALDTIIRATSLGGTETLIEHRASIEPPNRVSSPPGLLRLSVGLEDPADLSRDLARAIRIAQSVIEQ